MGMSISLTPTAIPGSNRSSRKYLNGQNCNKFLVRPGGSPIARPRTVISVRCRGGVLSSPASAGRFRCPYAPEPNGAR
jgi:hypothetical protein